MSKEIISVVINCDTRSGFLNKDQQAKPATSGVLSVDFLTEGIKNKVKFFEGHEVEFIIYVDIHDPLPPNILQSLTQYDNVILHKHTEQFEYREGYYPKFVDISIMQALLMSRGKYVVHLDWDMAMYRAENSRIIDTFKDWIDSGKYKYISYPSPYSPGPVIDPDFPEYWWVSTRFFFTKREYTEDYKEILACLNSNEYLYGKYGNKKRQCPWLEHILGIMVKKEEVFYPPLDNNYLIFSWSAYKEGLLNKLNNLPFSDVLNYVDRNGGIRFPCDVRAKEVL